MSINDLDFYTLNKIAYHLDIQSLYNFSRSSKNFKDVCQKVEYKQEWEKEIYDTFIDVVVDSIDLSSDVITSNNMFMIEAALNMIQYINGFIHNITKGFDNVKYPEEVIQVILKLSEILVNNVNKDMAVLCFESLANSSADDSRYEYSKEPGFSFKKNEFLKVADVFNERNSSCERIASCTYYRIPREINLTLLDEDKRLLGLVKNVTKLYQIPDTVTALAMQTIFGCKNQKVINQEKVPFRLMEEKELSLLINRLLDIQNMNLKNILSRSTFPKKIISYLTKFSYFAQLESFNQLIESYASFVKKMQYFCSVLYDKDKIACKKGGLFELVINKEYTKFLLKSVCIDNESKIYDKDDEQQKFKYSFRGHRNPLNIFYWSNHETDICYSINDMNVESYIEQDADFDLIRDDTDREDIEELNNIFNKFLFDIYLFKSYYLPPKFTITFLKLLYYVNQPLCYKYRDYYHVTLVNLK